MKAHIAAASLLLFSVVSVFGPPALAPTAAVTQFVPGDEVGSLAAGDQTAPAIAKGSDSSLAVWADTRARALIGFYEGETSSDIYGVRLDAGGRTYWRQVQPNQSYCSSNDPRVHFGLGSAPRVERVVVRWVSGAEESFGPFESGRQYDLREETGRKP